MSKTVLIAVFGALPGCTWLHAAEEILVTSQRSHSLEQFTASGVWVRTFATTGPYSPRALAQSPVTGEIFVTTETSDLTSTILRYHANGDLDTNWDTFKVICIPCTTFTPQTQSLLFDSSGDLWVATAYGADLPGSPPIYIFKYRAEDLTLPNLVPQPNPIMASMTRGNQMAFNKLGNLCIAGFIDEDVKCFDTTDGSQTADYYAEIHASGLGIEPVGLAFDAANRMYLTSVFGGQLAKEVSPGGPIVLLATLISSPNLLIGNLVLSGTNLYTSSYYNPPPTISTPDAVYEVSTGGTVTHFIQGGAAPTLGSDHLWGAAWMIFFEPTP